jgi:hypothetical protein
MRKIVLIMYEAVVPEQKKILNAELAVVVGADAEDVPSSIVAVLVDIVGVIVKRRKQENLKRRT